MTLMGCYHGLIAKAGNHSRVVRKLIQRRDREWARENAGLIAKLKALGY